jgi:hypothetical protein
MRMSNEFLIMFLFIWMLLHSCLPAHGHGIHVRDHKVSTPVTWVSGNTFKDADGKCWQVYKEAEPMSLSNQQLHIEEVTCK